MLGGDRGRCCGREVDGSFLPLRWSSEERVFSSITYEPFLTFFGGIDVSALTEKNHRSTMC